MIWAVSLLTMELIPHGLTAKHHLKAFGVWLNSVGLRPLIHPVPYLPKTTVEAVPKYISGRTSYLRVRLAFHPYPQLIPAFCTRHGFGPSPRDYLGFNLAKGRSHGFGSNPYNSTPYSDSLSLWLRNSNSLTVLHKLTRRLILQ